MLDHISKSMSIMSKNRLYTSARVVFEMQQYFDAHFGKNTLEVKNYRSGTLTVMVDRYLIEEFNCQREIIRELKKTAQRERVNVNWKGR